MKQLPKRCDRKNLLKLTVWVTCLTVLTLAAAGCGIIPCAETEPEPTEEPQKMETTPFYVQEPLAKPEETIPSAEQSMPLVDGEQFLLHHSEVMERFEAALAATDMPLTIDWNHELLDLNVLSYDLKCGDTLAAKVVFTFNPHTAMLQKLYFCDLREEKGETQSPSQQQMETAARLLVAVAHGAMTEDDWEAVDHTDKNAPFLDDRTYQTRQMMVAQLDGVRVYWDAANWAIAISEAIDPETGTLIS